jgi:hypothetical protein
MNDIKQVIYAMLQENTGVHMLDSGGVNGRMWQRNQTKLLSDFINEPEVSYEITKNYKNWKRKRGLYYSVYYTISVFHYLVNALTLDDICNEFNVLDVSTFNSHKKDYDIYGISDAQEEWLDGLVENHETDITKAKAWNSYNDDDCLSQTLQGTYCEIDDNYYVFLQIHGGADVRGGYTNVKLFKIRNNDYGFAMLPMQDVEGDIDGKSVSNRDCFPSLEWVNEETGNSAGEIELKKKPKEVKLYLMEY